MFFILSFGGHFYSAERNHLGNFGGVSYEKYMCEIILNLGQMSFKDVSISALATICFGGADPFLGLRRNIYMILF